MADRLGRIGFTLVLDPHAIRARSSAGTYQHMALFANEKPRADPKHHLRFAAFVWSTVSGLHSNDRIFILLKDFNQALLQGKRICRTCAHRHRACS